MVPCQYFLMWAFLAFVVGSDIDVPLSEDNRIIGGHEVVINQFPWQVSLQADGYHICGGAIISKQWVLTAAHCTIRYEPYQLKIRVGSNSQYKGGSLYKVKKVVVHEKYDAFILINDISAMKVASIIKFGPSVSKVALPKRQTWRPPVGTKLRVSGWGLTEGKKSTWLLRAVDVQVVDFHTCKDYFRDTSQATQICAGSQDKKFCDGDSGGPLVMDEVLVGLVSYSDTPCNSPGDGYTNVAFYRKWIKSRTGV